MAAMIPLIRKKNGNTTWREASKNNPETEGKKLVAKKKSKPDVQDKQKRKNERCTSFI
jgi:hypothetical protein